jgi:general stress protein YciG
MKKEIGFATMKKHKHRAVSSKGGKACPASTRTFSNREKAVEAGKKGAAARIAKLWAAKAHLLEK